MFEFKMSWFFIDISVYFIARQKLFYGNFFPFSASLTFLTNERYGLRYQFTRKGSPLHAEILERMQA